MEALPPSKNTDSESDDPTYELEDSASDSNGSAPESSEPKRPDVHILKTRARYLDLYNEHVASFFGYRYLDKRSDRDTLSASKNTTDSAYYVPAQTEPAPVKPKIEEAEFGDESMADSDAEEAPEHAEFDTLPGVLWTPAEKETFFDLLARFSIHRLDEFAPLIPTKTRVEIEAYYHLLKEQLDQLTEYKTYHVESDEKGRFPYMLQIYEQGQPYSTIPAACEVDEEWTQFENEQSDFLALCDRRSTDKERMQTQLDLALYIEATEDSTCNLVNFPVASEYCEFTQGNVMKGYGREGLLKPALSLTPLVLYDELIKVRVRDLIMAIMMRKGTSGVHSQAANTEAEDADILNASEDVAGRGNCVTNVDVWKATEDLRLFETRSAGFTSRYLHGNLPFVSAYVLELPPHEPSHREPEARITPEYTLFKRSRGKYQDTDVFMRQIDKRCLRLEVPDNVLDETAYALASEGEHGAGPGVSRAHGFASHRPERGPDETETETETETEESEESEDPETEPESEDEPETGGTKRRRVKKDLSAWEVRAPWEATDLELGLDTEPATEPATEAATEAQTPDVSKDGEGGGSAARKHQPYLHRATTMAVSTGFPTSFGSSQSMRPPTTLFPARSFYGIPPQVRRQLVHPSAANMEPPYQRFQSQGPPKQNPNASAMDIAALKERDMAAAEAAKKRERSFRFDDLEWHANVAATSDAQDICNQEAVQQEYLSFLEWRDELNNEDELAELKARFDIKSSLSRPQNPLTRSRYRAMRRALDRSYPRY